MTPRDHDKAIRDSTSAEHPVGLNLGGLQDFLMREHPEFGTGPARAQLITGGRSNLTYRLTYGTHQWVLRRPPLGHVLATAHDMGREFRVMGALAATAVPVPEMVLLHENPDVIGAPFYLMHEVPGTVYRTREQTAALGHPRSRALSFTLIDVLADLHEVDPDSVGLGDFGRPQNFMRRQVRRWRTQLDASLSRPLPDLEELHLRLDRAVPEPQRAAIVHGDYRLDNTLIGPGETVAAVLDWEMSTIGDPLADLGLFTVYWDGLANLPGNPVSGGVHPEAGFASSAELIDHYCRRTGLDASPLPWYIAFGYYKLAIICEGIRYRHLQGLTAGDGFQQMGDLVDPLTAHGLAELANP